MLTPQTDVVIHISNNFGDSAIITTAEDVFYRHLSKPNEYETRCDFVFHKIEEQEWNDLMTCLKNGRDSIFYIKIHREDGSISFLS